MFHIRSLCRRRRARSRSSMESLAFNCSCRINSYPESRLLPLKESCLYSTRLCYPSGNARRPLQCRHNRAVTDVAAKYRWSICTKHNDTWNRGTEYIGNLTDILQYKTYSLCTDIFELFVQEWVDCCGAYPDLVPHARGRWYASSDLLLLLFSLHRNCRYESQSLSGSLVT